MPTDEIETLRVNHLLTTIYITLKDIRDVLNSEPVRQASLLDEFVGWADVMIELLTIISIHRGLNLPDDCPEGLSIALSLSKNMLRQENSVTQDLLLAGCEVIDRLDGILSTSVINISSAPKIKQDPPREKKAKGFLNFFRLASSRASPGKEPDSLVESSL